MKTDSAPLILLKTKRIISGYRLQHALLLLFILLYIYNITKYFWTLPVPSDSLQYLGSASWGTTWAYWPWLDRINLAVNLRIFTMLFSKTYIAGMVYIGFINTIILIASMFWAFKKSGFWAALLVGILINSSFLMLGWSTYIYPDQTVALYALLAFIVFFWDTKQQHYFGPVFLAGVFAAFASFTKATGVVVPIFFIAYSIINKDWKNLTRLLSGILIGSILIIVLFIGLFNWQSLVNTFQHFFKSSIGNNLSTGSGLDGAAYFHEIILSMKYFPFIALFFAAGAYRKQNTRDLFLLAWLNILFVCFVRMLSPSVPSYIYLAYVFTCLGLSVYLSDLINSKEGTDNKNKISNIFIMTTSLVALIFIIIGLHIGFKYGPVKDFEYGYNYLKPLDIYDANNLLYPSLIKRLYSFSPLLILGSLTYVVVTKAKRAIILFALIVSLLASFLNGGLAYKKANFDREDANFFYENAPLFNLVPAKTFSVYVEAWNKHNYSDRLLWVYRIFFDEKYQRVFEPKYKSQYLNESEVTSNINYITKEEDLPSQTLGTQILTDNPSIIYKYFPNARKIKQIFPDQPENKLVLLDIANKSILKKTLFTFEIDLSKWKGKNNLVKMGDLNKVLPPLEIVGVRGDFNFINNSTEDNRTLRVVLDKPHPSEQSLILFGNVMGPEINIRDNESDEYITIDVELKLPNDGGNHILFIQDQLKENWEKNSIALNHKGDKAYSITRVLRKDFSSVIAGINFIPQSEGDWIEIKHLKITVWSKLE
jgi:hypothetical protein